MEATTSKHQQCPKCTATVPAASHFCNHCGHALEVLQANPAGTAERKQVSVLFSDLTGFTALTEQLDPEETKQIIGRIFECAADIVGRYEGRIEKFVGDAIMAIFGVPLAHEDDPQRAVRAALELHDAIAAMSPEIEARTGVAISMHSGINTGLVVTGELQFDHGTAGPLGDTINTAARLMNGAASGEIWIGPETINLVADTFDLVDLGKHEFKGKANAISVARIVGLREHSLRSGGHQLHGEFVGRQAELGVLLEAAEKIRDKESLAIGICGDAGTGKTRLVSEFHAQLGDEILWFEGRAYPFAKDTPYGLFIDLLNRIWQIDNTDSPVLVRRKVIAGIQDVLGENDSAQSLYLHLFGLDQDEGVVIEREAFRDRLLATTQRILNLLTNRAPLVVCFQDMHWADASSQQLLADLTNTQQPGVLLLANYRPEYTPSASMQQLTLTELSARQSGDLLRSLLQGEPPDGLANFVANRCDGNPFYVEEIVNALFETGTLIRDENGWTLSRPLTETSIPSTIRAVIAARIDRLEGPRRQLLRHAAVVGRQFMVKIVSLLEDSADDLMSGLHQLQAADLIRPVQLEPDVEFMFKHALTQDVAYEGLLKTERLRLHERTAKAMENVFAERLPEYVEVLAYHYLRGGMTDKAIHYLVQAGHKCVGRYALAEATNHYRQAYALIPDSDLTTAQRQSLTDLLIAWAQVFYYNGTIKQWHSLFEKHLPDARACNDQNKLIVYLGWLGNVRCFHGDFDGGREALHEASELAQTHNDPIALALIAGWRGFAMQEGQLTDRSNVVDFLNGITHSEKERRSASYAYCKAQAALAHGLLFQGELAQCQQVSSALVTLGQQTGNARADGLGHLFLSFSSLMALDYAGAVAYANAGRDGARDPLFECMNSCALAMAQVSSLDAVGALATCDIWQSYLDQNENQWQGVQLKLARACANLMTGNLSNGLRQLLSLIGLTQTQGRQATRTMVESSLLSTYVSIARMDVKPTLNVLARNPWFTLTQAPFAARRARALATRMRLQMHENNNRGFLPTVELADGRLFVHQGNIVEATACLERIRATLHSAGMNPDPAPVMELADEIRQRS